MIDAPPPVKKQALRQVPSKREEALAALAISDLKTGRDGAPDEYRIYVDKHSGGVVFRPIHYGKPECG